VVLHDLRDPTPDLVMARGEIAVREGEVQADFPTLDWGAYFPRRFQPTWDPRPSLFDFRPPRAGGEEPVLFPVMHLENSVITRTVEIPLSVDPGGRLQPPPGVVRAALMDPGGRWIVRGLLSNFVSRMGGLASSFNAAAQLVVLGQDTSDMAGAARRVLELGGGIVIVEGGATVLEIALPIGGVMAPKSLRALADQARPLYAFLRDRGYAHADPHYTLLFLPMDSLPDVRLTYRGVWDVRRGKALVPREDL
jgi:adenine deaminase